MKRPSLPKRRQGRNEFGAAWSAPERKARRRLVDCGRQLRGNSGPNRDQTLSAEVRRFRTFPPSPRNEEVRPTAAVCSGLQKRLSTLVPAAAPSRKSVGVRMAASRRPKLRRNAKKPILSGASVGRQCCSGALFARGDGLVQQRPDFLASDVARPTALAPSVAHFVCLCSKEFPFQGVKQRR
jgi:hypothetical protein